MDLLLTLVPFDLLDVLVTTSARLQDRRASNESRVQVAQWWNRSCNVTTGQSDQISHDNPCGERYTLS